MENRYHFDFTDFLRVITAEGWHYFEPRDNELLDQIFEHHYKPQNQMRIDVGKPMRVTGCYRPTLWEKRKGRDGTSQHCFVDHNLHDGVGATDVEPWNGSDNTEEVFIDMAQSLISSYQRCCFYPLEGFFHNDYKAKSDQRFVMEYEYDAERKIWKQKSWMYVQDHQRWLELIAQQWKEMGNKR